jgi:hypothetical protein
MFCFCLFSFGFTGTDSARHMLTQLASLLKPYDAHQILDDGNGNII